MKLTFKINFRSLGLDMNPSVHAHKMVVLGIQIADLSRSVGRSTTEKTAVTAQSKAHSHK